MEGCYIMIAIIYKQGNNNYYYKERLISINNTEIILTTDINQARVFVSEEEMHINNIYPVEIQG